MNTRSILKIVVGLGLLLALSACAGANPVVTTPDTGGSVAGFWQGLVDGLIIPITWLISMFNNNVQIYDVHNDGGWYNFGFLLGIACTFGGSGSASSR